MGAGGISIWQLLIILVIVLLLFGTKRLKNLGSDLGTAIKGFRSAMSDADKEQERKDAAPEQLSEAERTDAKATNASAESHKRQP
ncbi:Sec-independent protein translocase subunit TatA [Marichromatium gracile]|uniref:Sec-independent protein translocase protein TatA n=1 Tax=Marichromatium gracile TaxID=1048 RepID=A0ABR5VDB2_MARGR|nr:Sec-independent protein translocase subunit TatA [Marichromatium gracile]KXX63690.1 preprotein translocase subunit TatA [Marichromatium gracile]